jgi:ParB family chromosome partitioning protein
MATAVQKIILSSSRDIPFNKLVLSQSNVRRVKAGVSIDDLAASIARRGLIQSLSVFPVVDAEGVETGMFEVPAGCLPVAPRSSEWADPTMPHREGPPARRQI